MLLTEEAATKDLPRDARLGDPAGKMKQFATWFTHGVPGGAKLRAAIYHARTGAAVLSEVEGFFMPRLEAGPAFPLDASDAPEDEAQAFPVDTLVCD
jgi:hypothetical protein